MIFDTIDDALRSVWDYDDFVDGMQFMYLTEESDKRFFKEYIEANPQVTADELIDIAIGLAEERDAESQRATRFIEKADALK